MNQSGIYEIVNTMNGKRYIGSAKNFKTRWREHVRRLRLGNHHSRHLQSAWNKYGLGVKRLRTPEHTAKLVASRAANKAAKLQAAAETKAC